MGLVPTSRATPVVAQQQPELFEVVIGEQVGARQRGLVDAGTGDEAIGQARIRGRGGIDMDANERVTPPHPLFQGSVGDEFPKRLTHEIDIGTVDGLDLRERQGGIVKE